jgi:hypothetical protein
MSMQSIRQYYSVPAKRGGRLRYSGNKSATTLMEIIGSKDQYLRCRIIDGPNAGLQTLLHPTWEIEYL